MNCKPNDLAVIYRADLPADRIFIGRIIRVVKVVPHNRFGHPCWTYDGPRLLSVFGNVTAVADHDLHPIRDPGDDAVDQFARKREVEA